MANFAFARSTIKVSEHEGNSFAVRGLSMNDISRLATLHRPIVEDLLERYVGLDPEALTAEDISAGSAKVIVGLLEQVPAFLAHVIALGADDVEAFEEYSTLPMGVQLDALSEIGSLTVAGVGGQSKVRGLVANIAKSKSRPVQ
jgi:hypothetical protein